MRSAFSSFFPATVAIVCIAMLPAVALAQKSDDLPPDREEIIVTHSKLGPLSDWAAMQQHTADYERLKAKFDPTTGSSHVENWTSDRSLASHSNASDAFMQESADQPTPSAVKAVEDAVVPP
jgi:hypothetical protein